MSAETTPKKKKPNWEVQHRIFCVKNYYKCGSYKKISEQFHTIFEMDRAPPKSVIQDWVNKFEKFGSVLNLNTKTPDRSSHSGRPRTRTQEVIDKVRESVEQSPKRSLRRRSQALNLSVETCRRVIVDDLKQYPYRIQTKQKLTVADKTKRKAMAEKMLDKMEVNPKFLGFLWTSDEAHFHLEGKVNSKNNVFWGSQKPTEVAQKPLHSAKCTVWAAISERGIIGPFFFEEHGSQVTVTKERYIEVLKDFWKELESLYPSWMKHFWFQQDGASPHTSHLSQDWLKQHFGKRVVSLKTDFEWAPHSPDLSPPDFFLWGYLKDKVYANKPRTISELKVNIREEIRAIPRSVCKSVMLNFAMRLKKCVDLNGGHLEQVL